jgi:PsbP
MNRNRHQSCLVSLMLLICSITLLLAAGCIEPRTPQVNATPVPTYTTIPITFTTAAPTIIAASPGTPVPTPARPFNHYTNSEYGFSIDYPVGWQQNELNTQEAYDWGRYDVVEFYSPSFLRCNSEKSDCVNVRSEVEVEVDTSPGAELDTFFVKDVARITTENNVEITKRDAMFKLSGAMAYRLDYLVKTDTGDINTLRAYTIQNDKGYIITFHAHAPVRNEKNNQFEEYYNDVMAMFKSFTITAGNYKTI